MPRQNNMQTPTPPPPAPHPQFEVVHALGRPATAATDVSTDTRLTLGRLPSYILLLISYLTVPLSQFFAIVYLWAVLFIPFSGL